MTNRLRIAVTAGHDRTLTEIRGEGGGKPIASPCSEGQC